MEEVVAVKCHACGKCHEKEKRETYIVFTGTILVDGKSWYVADGLVFCKGCFIEFLQNEIIGNLKV